MNLGMVGLGKMGGNMTERLRRAGHTVETYARTDPARTAGSLVELVGKLDHPRVVWLMIPAGDPTENAFQTLVPLLEDGDIIVDGGNSNFRDSQRRAEVAGTKSIHFLDAGVSGGVWGLEEGYCIMVGGPAEGFALIEPFVRDPRPGRRLRARRRVGRRSLREDGAQRDRVRDDAVARRGLRDHARVRARARSAAARRRSGSTARSFAAGCSSCSSARSPRIPTSPASAVMSRTPAKGAGRWRRRSTSACRRRPSRLRSSPASRRARTSRSPPR